MKTRFLAHPRDRLFVLCAVLLVAFCLTSTGCKSVPATSAPTPASPAAIRDSAVEARDSLLAALLDAWAARVPDLSTPEKALAMIKAVRAGIRVTPKAADNATATATVEAVAKGDLKPADGAAKDAGARASAIEAAVKAEREARIKAEQALAAEREAHAAEVRDLKASWSKNLQLWIARGFAGVGTLVVAISISAIFWAGLAAKKQIVGGIVSGMVCIAVGLAVGERWFLIAGRIAIGLLIASLIGWGVYLIRTSILERRTRTAIQDAKDEAVNGGEQAERGWAWLKEHLMYRMPRTKTGDASAVEKEIDRRLVAEGVNT